MSPNTVFDALVVGGSDDTTFGKLDNLLDGFNTRVSRFWREGDSFGATRGVSLGYLILG
jgi:hypothetical protein